MSLYQRGLRFSEIRAVGLSPASAFTIIYVFNWGIYLPEARAVPLGSLLFPVMVVQIPLRTLRTCQPRGVLSIYRLCQNRKYGYLSPDAKRNLITPSAQIKASPSLSSKEVPLTIESHGPVIQNPKHTKKAVSCTYDVLMAVIFFSDKYLSDDSQGCGRIGSLIER
jgi:hypothetical protein